MSRETTHARSIINHTRVRTSLCDGGSPRGLADYYVDTAYPIERTGHGGGQVRAATYGDGATSPGGDLFLVNPSGAGLNAEKALIAAYNTSGDRRLRHAEWSGPPP